LSFGTWFRAAMNFFASKVTGSGTTYEAAAAYTAVYSVIWKDDSGQILRELVPCRKSDGTVCMYDPVGEIYYTNACTTTLKHEFIADPAV